MHTYTPTYIHRVCLESVRNWQRDMKLKSWRIGMYVYVAVRHTHHGRSSSMQTAGQRASEEVP